MRFINFDTAAVRVNRFSVSNFVLFLCGPLRALRDPYLFFLLIATTATGQGIDDDWARRHQAAIEQHRMADVQFLILDPAGRPVEGATVKIKQTRHAFEVGVLANGDLDGLILSGGVLWAQMNAIDLSPQTGWRDIMMGALGPGFGTYVTRLGGIGFRVTWGALFSADPAAMPDKIVPQARLRTEAAAKSYMASLLPGVRLIANRYDLCDDTLDHDRFTPAMLRVLRLEIDAIDPDAEVFLPFDGGLQGPRVNDVRRAIDKAQHNFLDLDGYTIRQRFSGKVDQVELTRNLNALATLCPAIVVSGLEVGGPSAVDRTINMERVLRTLFAEPKVKGIYFAGFTADQLADPDAALIDEKGELTGAGRSVDQLFGETWWTDLEVKSDLLGEAEARVFLGTHRVTVTFPGADGKTLTVPLRVDEASDPPRRVVLQAIE